MNSRKAVSGELGKQLLDVITSGMYSDPRMAIREYIQNAVDSIDLAHFQGLFGNAIPYVQITLDGRERAITIEDNGVGISVKDIDDRLGSLGCSSKIGTSQRGFRGIGRLGGLAYCDVLRFETRQTICDAVQIVEWNGQALRDQISHLSNQEQLGDAVRRIATIGSRRAKPDLDPTRFFRVHMVNVHQFHADLLMNVKTLREYLSQTAPVAYKIDEFPFSAQIEQHLAKIPGYRSYNILLNNKNVFRPYNVEITTREGLTDRINDVEFVECFSRQGSLLCKGWFAQTGFLSALPPHVEMRGIRIRQGNIAVGDEYFLKDRFTESRFATWHIGELHVTHELKLNARRDGFEESAEYEDFLEWASVLCRRLSSVCRQSSNDRSIKQNISRMVIGIERQLSIPFFVDKEHANGFIEATEKQVLRLRQLLPEAGIKDRRTLETFGERLTKIKNRPVFLNSILDGRILRRKDNRQILIELCKKILSINHGSDISELLMQIVGPYLKNQKVVE